MRGLTIYKTKTYKQINGQKQKYKGKQNEFLEQ